VDIGQYSWRTNTLPLATFQLQYEDYKPLRPFAAPRYFGDDCLTHTAMKAFIAMASRKRSLKIEARKKGTGWTHMRF